MKELADSRLARLLNQNMLSRVLLLDNRLSLVTWAGSGGRDAAIALRDCIEHLLAVNKSISQIRIYVNKKSILACTSINAPTVAEQIAEKQCSLALDQITPAYTIKPPQTHEEQQHLAIVVLKLLLSGEFSPLDESVLLFLFGLIDGQTHTIEETAVKFKIRSQAVRQSEARLLRSMNQK